MGGFPSRANGAETEAVCSLVQMIEMDERKLPATISVTQITSQTTSISFSRNGFLCAGHVGGPEL